MLSIFPKIKIGNIFINYRTANAQIIGTKQFQRNYITSAYDDYGNFLAVMSDGTIDHPCGCLAAEAAAEYCVLAFKKKQT